MEETLKVKLHCLDDVVSDHEIVIIDGSGMGVTGLCLAQKLYDKNTLKQIEEIGEDIRKALKASGRFDTDKSLNPKFVSPMEVADDLKEYARILMESVNKISSSSGGQGYTVAGRPYLRRPSVEMIKETFAKNFRLLSSVRAPYKLNLLNLALLAEQVRKLSDTLASTNCYNGPLWEIELSTMDGSATSDISDLVVAGAAVAYALEKDAKVAVIANDKDIYRIILAVARTLDPKEGEALREKVKVFSSPRDPARGHYLESERSWFEERYGHDTVKKLIRSSPGIGLRIPEDSTPVVTAATIRNYNPK